MKAFTLLYNIIPKDVYKKIAKSDTRSKEALKNIVISLLVKIANIVSSLLVLPLTISYVNPTQYGIWLSISTIIGWVTFFDLGLGNGFRNRFAQAKAEGNLQLAREYVSTTYFAITSIVMVLYSVVLLVNAYIDWAEILNLSQSYRIELQKVFAIVCGFVCLNMIANIFSTLLTADQKPGMSSIIQGCGQYMSLLVIFILTKVSDGSLTNLALYYSGVPCMVMLITSIVMFNFSRYRQYKPRIKDINISLIKSILGLGSQFFFIYLCLIAIFQVVNIVISREIGAVGVTEYNVANRYFNILYMVINIIIMPFWSAFTDAYTKKDVFWMKKTMKRLEYMWLFSIALGIVMLVVSPLFYKIWVGEKIEVSFVLSFSTLILTLSRTIGCIYMFMINGIGAVRIQLVTYIAFALIAWPSLVYSCRLFGICGIVIVPTLVYSIQALLAKTQLKRLINGTATGIWTK